MKDQRFIELVNLYIDRQISAAETAELEGEIQGNPRRRAVYRQYCKMHRATTLVYESFRAEAPDQQSAQPADQGVIAQFENERRQRRYRWSYYASGLAAAACLGLLLFRLNSTPAAAPDQVTVASLPPAPRPAVVAQPIQVAASPVAVAPAATLVSLRNSATAEPDYAALLTAMRQEEQRAFASGQIQSGRLPSLFEDGVFDSQQVMPPANQRTFHSKQTPAQQAEFTAFQFQR